MIKSGLAASELIKSLQKLIEEYGDRPVFLCSSDYPAGVGEVEFVCKGNAYTPKGVFKMWPTHI